MDQDSVVSQQTESGRRLIEALGTAGFEVRVAFWAKPTEDDKWFLYLVSPIVDEKGPAIAYRFIIDILRQIPDIWLDAFDVKVVGLNDSLAKAALAVPKPYPGMTRFGGSVLGGVSIDGAYIYPAAQSAAQS